MPASKISKIFERKNKAKERWLGKTTEKLGGKFLKILKEIIDLCEEIVSENDQYDHKRIKMT